MQEKERRKHVDKILVEASCANRMHTRMSPLEVAKETVLADLKTHLGTDAFLKAIERVEDAELARCAGIETRRPGNGWFTLAAIAGYHTATKANGRVAKPLADDVHGPSSR